MSDRLTSVYDFMKHYHCSLKELYDNREKYVKNKRTPLWLQWLNQISIENAWKYETTNIAQFILTTKDITNIERDARNNTSNAILKSILTYEDFPYDIIGIFNTNADVEHLTQHYKSFYYGNYEDVMGRDVTDYLIDDFENPCNDASGCYTLLMACNHVKLEELLHDAFIDLISNLSRIISDTLQQLENAKTTEEFKSICNEYSLDDIYPEIDSFQYDSAGFIFKNIDEAKNIVNMLRPIQQYEHAHNLSIISELSKCRINLLNLYVLHYWHKLTNSYDNFESVMIHFNSNNDEEFCFEDDNE